MLISAITPAPLIGPAELTSASRPVSAPGAATAPEGGTATEPQPFGQVLGRELGRVNDALAAADRQAELVATGDAPDLHQAMVAMAEADLALQVTMHVTQKAIAAYQEISRMQL